MSDADLLISNISNWFARKDVLITGSSGFMGKILVEKLLRSCPNLRNIYVLIRPKKGLTPKQRISAFIENPLFDFVKHRNAAVFEKLIAIDCDVSKAELGISKKDQELLFQNVSIVLHSAATVKFEDPLKYAVAVNVVGTQQLLEMCYQMKRLEAFVYISTAYSNCNIFEIEEKVYPPQIDPDELINELENVKDEHLEELKRRVVNDRPNLYSATKSLAEVVVGKHSGRLPVVIVRPSIVCGALNEPLIGWVDNLNGATGIIMGIGKGLIRSLLMEVDCVADLVPVDLSINMILAAAWGCTQSKRKQLKVYNFTSGSVNPLCWGPFIRLSEKYFKKYALTGTLWYPNTFLQPNIFLHKLIVLLLHGVPAHVIDLVLKLSGKQPIMTKIQKQFNSAINAMEYFTTHTWKFKTENVQNLFASLSEIDKRIFNFDLRTLDWESYMENYCKGIRVHVLKDSLETLPKARAKLEKLKYIHFGLKIMLYTIIIWILFWFICKLL